ncbi:DNA methyltransferase [Burkholderia cepacia]|uniref:type I restriction-modification system subunit M n=1 Tax=Burkholderia cepacia TaxID=292 RepID=UPI0007532C22|nr:class I SAM-dependent DNA methyltransferase [Burkholderia cepacia]KVA60560.1 DNA methyltransferase [Burkholderia cepacia]KVA62062.1 DNA methyltransferase [Burkholderia cepacia]KVA77893.1 DNA methyltransferase [Burkholderia cepacia]KVA82968.1 DNA methyltransferase [Burkholderia cepacia]KVA87979.1 DNA methyltransferase [Burkholderia cepacia]
MQSAQHQNLVGFIWNIANKLRGPYRPPQYRRVMLPLIVLRRFDLVLAENKQMVLDEKKRLEHKGITGPALEKALSRIAATDRKQELFNTSGFTFEKLLGDAPNIAGNLIAYIQGFSPRARDIFDKFEFETEIAKLDEANRLYLIVKEFCSSDINLSPKVISNLQMGYLFEELVRKFNEQANEEAGDHFTPREVIRLMVQLLFTGEDGIYEKGIYRSVYDPTAGTGGMLSESEKFICGDGFTTGLNPDANIELFGQEYNPESYAICCSDLLIKDEPINNLIYGDTLGIKDAKNKTNGFVPHDGHPDKKFHYMLANPPFGVEWKPEEDFVREEYADQGFSGRFGAGLPRINDGSLLFLQHMVSKMHQPPRLVNGKNLGGDGSKIAIVFNGSPLFTGDAGAGESNIRRWIIERDMLDAIVALPDQMFYNTGIYTYVWIVTNKKPLHRQGKVQLIDGTRHFKKMDKSLGNKRNELSDDHIKELVRLYAEHEHDAVSDVFLDGKPESRVCSKIFENREFGYLKITVERPLRLNFRASAERIAKLNDQSAFINLASSKKRKSEAAYAAEVAEGKETQAAIIAALQGMDSESLYRSRPAFEAVLDRTLKEAGIKVGAPVRKAILAALCERDSKADICLDAKGKPEPDTELRDTEIVALPRNISLPLPLGYDNETDHDKLLVLVQDHCENYLKAEVLPHVKDAWIDHSKTKVGYEIPLTRHFYVYQPPRPLGVIAAEISQLEKEIVAMLSEVV